jgi:protease-4
VKRSQIVWLSAIIVAPVIMGVILYLRESSDIDSGTMGNPLKKIGLVRIINEIFTSEDYIRQLHELRTDKTIAGVVLRIDSPGGAVAPSQEIFAEVMRYREDDKPLVVSMGNVAASGGYYIAAPAMRIFANPGTITGSIGVIISFPQYYKLLEKIGVKLQTIKSGEFKDVGSPSRELTAKERLYLQQFIDDTYDQFITDVSTARGMSVDSVRELADGRIYTGRQAAKLGLVDSLGGFEEAITYLRKYIGLSEKTKIIEKRRRTSVFRDLFVEEFFDKLPLVRSLNKRAGGYFMLDAQ